MKTASILVFAASLPMFAQEGAPQTVKGLTAASGLEVTLWASEPMLANPTNMDIDARGRIWVLEGVNYRRQLMGQKDYRGGDRILILEDTNLDGRADKVKVFDQGPHLRSPLGIAVFGNRVVVSQSPDAVVYTKDEDDRIISKETLVTGWRGVDHDHGLHAFVFGPDGRYYFNSGDQGFDVTDRGGRRLVSSRKGDYYAGTALRINADGTGFTVLGHNFRNPYELALDSFGNIWQTDNDDDGNAWTRVNYVMQGGNFGYWGPGGRSWREDRGSHFHSELPGVVPNIARTGAGSPCGLVVYEGTLLPAKYRGQLLHAEAGRRYINTYLLEPDGAGYTMKTENTVSGPDMWFRPSDVAVGPDGAVYISDWYDPAVGGHQMKDLDRGRIYRLAPAGFKARAPKMDLATEAGVAEALRSPAMSVRMLAWTRLKEQGAAALPALEAMTRSGDPLLRARALWLLGDIPGPGEQRVREALRDPDPRFRVLALRILAGHSGADFAGAARGLLRDASPAVRREIAVSLAGNNSDAAVEALADLAVQYDGKDRWYLEALGIGARGKENALFTRLRTRLAGSWNQRLGQLLWELRPPDALPYLVTAVRNVNLPVTDRIEALAALAAMPSLEAAQPVADVANDASAPAELAGKAFELLSRRVFSEWSDLRDGPAVRNAVSRALQSPAQQARAVEFIDEMEDASFTADLLALARNANAAEELRAAAVQAAGKSRKPEILPDLEKLTADGPLAVRIAAARALGSARAPEATFQRLILSNAPNEVRTEAVRALGRSESGVTMLLNLEESQQLPAELRNAATGAVSMSRNPAQRARAAKLLPPFTGRNKQPFNRYQLIHEDGDAARGRRVFQATAGPKCNSCHTAGEAGKKSVGPDLANIGGKLGKDALLDSILNPSAGIAHEYQVTILETTTQGQVIGIVSEDTPQRVIVRNELGDEIRLKPSEIKSRRPSHLSLMPEDLVSTMTMRELMDLLEYLMTLK